MSDVAWVTLALVIVTILYVVTVWRQVKQSEKNILLQIRYRLESDVTQIRTTRALIIRKTEGWEKLEDREKQCSETISELAKKIEKFERGFKLTDFFKRVADRQIFE